MGLITAFRRDFNLKSGDPGPLTGKIADLCCGDRPCKAAFQGVVNDFLNRRGMKVLVKRPPQPRIAAYREAINGF